METLPPAVETAPSISKHELALREAFVEIDQRIEECLRSFGEVTEVSVNGRLQAITNATEQYVAELQAQLRAAKEVYEEVKGKDFYRESAAVKLLDNFEKHLALAISDAEVARYVTKLPTAPEEKDKKYKVVV